jgi:ribosomal protein L24
MKQKATAPQLKDGNSCIVTAGTHKGKSGIVRDINTSKTGTVTITVVQKSGVRFKTLAKNVTADSKTAKAAPAKPSSGKDIAAYNKKQAAADKKICDLLYQEIAANLPKAESKIWHAHPVWFLEGNPIVGYHKMKDCVRLLFWSGNSFDEPGLQKEGGFQTAGARYTSADEINTKDLKRWLKKSVKIQWDYKNIVKRKGVLERLK